MGSIRGKAHPLPDTAHSTSQHFSGAMEEMSQTVQNANTHKLRRQNHEHAHSSHSQFKDWFKGAMDESSGKGSKMQAHITSGVVMDITAFEVSHSFDIDATALQAKKRSA